MRALSTLNYTAINAIEFASLRMMSPLEWWSYISLLYLISCNLCTKNIFMKLLSLKALNEKLELYS